MTAKQVEGLELLNQLEKGILQCTDLVHSAHINLGNLASVVPELEHHPFYLIVERQLRDALQLLGRKVGE